MSSGISLDVSMKVYTQSRVERRAVLVKAPVSVLRQRYELERLMIQ
jgi:hypothetical protein